MQAQVPGERLYGLDWLRIGAFALLILYHIGMFFVPWEWHVKTSRPIEWLEIPMMAINPWRLALLFVVSGYASRVLMAKLQGRGSFVASRSARLLVPLLAGMVLFVAPQPWAELRQAGLIGDGFWTFWGRDYFRFGKLHGLDLPTWNHLWFVAYLWVYTLVLAALASLPVTATAGAQRAFDRVFAGRGLMIWPIILLATARIWLFPVFGETHALVNDAYAHVVYGFAFFFGVGLARSAASWDRIVATWRRAIIIGIAAYVLIIVIDLTVPDESGELELAVLRVARSVQAWGMIVGLLGLARTRLNFDNPARRYLTEAIFPYYIAHQTIIVLAGYWLTPLGLGPGPELLIIFLSTIAGCALTYELGRRVAVLRPFVGLKARRPESVMPGSLATA